MGATGDVWLLKFRWPDHEYEALGGLQSTGTTGLQMWRSTDGYVGYAYVPAQPLVGDPPARAFGADWRRLVCALVLSGSSAGMPITSHYVVETDVLPEHEDDFNAWYAKEHLPGLAAVPGMVSATRYIDEAGSPRYYACYWLTSPDIVGCPAWLAVRATRWSSIVRPSFRNTKRTLFRRPSTDARSFGDCH